MSAASQIAAGLLRFDNGWPDRVTVIAHAADELRAALNASTVWQSAWLPPELSGGLAKGDDLAWWSPRDDVTAAEEEILEAAWTAALPDLTRGMRTYLRLRVDTSDTVRRLRSIGEVDGLVLVPSLDSRGRMRPLTWRWPFRVAVVDGPLAGAWLSAVQNSEHHGLVFDAALHDVDGAYEIAIVAAADLPTMSGEIAAALGDVACVIVCGDDPVEDMLRALERRIEPMVAIAVNGPLDLWWRVFFHELSHDVPVDAAVETMVRFTNTAALIAGPRWGMDVTASAHWFAAVAPDYPLLAPLLNEYAGWDWRYESGGATMESHHVRELIAHGEDPVAVIPPPAMAAPVEAATPSMDAPEAARGRAADPGPAPKEPSQAKPRRLVTRVFDGQTVVKKVLPPRRELSFAVRIAVPERADTAAAGPAVALPAGPGSTVELEVVVSGDVWDKPPESQTISLSRRNLESPSTWAAFPFTSPAAGKVVRIEIVVLFQGKPLQAATFESAVRTFSIPLEKPKLTAFALSGPDEPVADLRPVDVTLDGTGAELRHLHGSDARVLITDVQSMLDTIEDQVSRVIGVPGAPDSFDDPRALQLLITVAGIGAELATFLDPLHIGEGSINVLVNPLTRVMPLELVYTGPVPDDNAKLCDHVIKPPPLGEACTKATTKRVCPYAFWGLHRSIARTIKDRDSKIAQPWSSTIAASSMLYAATIIADDGAVEPFPSASVFTAAQGLYRPATRVNSWRAWRAAVRDGKPDVLVVLGHTMIEGGKTNLYIGKESVLERKRISAKVLSTDGSRRPLVLLIACSTAALGDAFGTLPGTLTAKGAGAVVATLSKITGPHGAAATTHLLQALHGLAGRQGSVGDAVTQARRSLISEKRPIGLMLVSHGELDMRVGT